MNIYFNEPKEITASESHTQLRTDQHAKIEKYLESSLFLYGAGELKNLLLQDLVKLDIPKEVKFEVFQPLVQTNQRPATLDAFFLAMCRDAPDLVIRPLIDAPADAFVTVFGDFFDGREERREHRAARGQSDSRRDSRQQVGMDVEVDASEKARQNEWHVEHFFNHFVFEGPRKGAVAIEQYALRKRNEIWSEDLVWHTSRPVTPVAIAKQQQLWMHLDVLQTVRNFLRADNGHEFLLSRELYTALQGGGFLDVDPMYFARLLSDLYAASYADELYEIKRLLPRMVEDCLNRLSFQSLLAALFPVLSDAELLLLVARVARREPFTIANMVIKTQWTSLTQLLIFNGLNAHRSHVMLCLMREAGEQLILLLPMHSSEEDRLEDYTAHWGLYRSVCQSVAQPGASKEATLALPVEMVKFLLLEAFMIHSKLLVLKPEPAILKVDFAREFCDSIRVDEVFWSEKEVADAKEPHYELIESSSEEEKQKSSKHKHKHSHKSKHHHHHAKEKKEKSSKKRKRKKDTQEDMFQSGALSSERNTKARKLDATFLGWKFVNLVGSDCEFSCFKSGHVNYSSNNSNASTSGDGFYVSAVELPLFLSTLFVERCFGKFVTCLSSRLPTSERDCDFK